MSIKPTITRFSSARSAFFPVQPSPSPYQLSSSPPATTKPNSSLWYTGRSSLHKTHQSLLKALSLSRAHLYRSGVIPSINSPLTSITAASTKSTDGRQEQKRKSKWKDLSNMTKYLKQSTALRSSQYKLLTRTLGQIESLLPLVKISDSFPSSSFPKIDTNPLSTTSTYPPSNEPSTTSAPLQDQLETLLSNFKVPSSFDSSGNVVERIFGKERHLGTLDPEGRVRAVGKRKESAARVWIVPTSSTPSTPTTSVDRLPIPGQILVNSLPLPKYFTSAPHRETILKPLSLTNSLGGFNVFVLVKGGGLAAQSEAVAMGIGRALVEWERSETEIRAEKGKVEGTGEEWRDILKKAKLLERDPRMVERKKTGQPKSRKKNAWVKR